MESPISPRARRGASTTWHRSRRRGLALRSLDDRGRNSFPLAHSRRQAMAGSEVAADASGKAVFRDRGENRLHQCAAAPPSGPHETLLALLACGAGRELAERALSDFSLLPFVEPLTHPIERHGKRR